MFPLFRKKSSIKCWSLFPHTFATREHKLRKKIVSHFSKMVQFFFEFENLKNYSKFGSSTWSEYPYVNFPGNYFGNINLWGLNYVFVRFYISFIMFLLFLPLFLGKIKNRVIFFSSCFDSTLVNYWIGNEYFINLLPTTYVVHQIS